MGLVDRLVAGKRRHGLRGPNVAADWRERDAWREWDAPLNAVVGESHRQDALAAICGPVRPNGYLLPVEVELCREPGNPHDRDAIAASIDGRQVGYLRRELAALLADELDRAGCASFRLCGLIRGGSPRAPQLGAHVWVDRRLCPGPTIALDWELAGPWQVSWPPFDGEGEG